MHLDRHEGGEIRGGAGDRVDRLDVEVGIGPESSKQARRVVAEALRRSGRFEFGDLGFDRFGGRIEHRGIRCHHGVEHGVVGRDKGGGETDRVGSRVRQVDVCRRRAASE